MNDTSWLLYLGVAIASLIGAFLGAFIKRIGEDFAAQQSIQKLTATVENIKAAISDDVWDRQKQWEMRRDAVFEAIRALGKFDNVLLDLAHAYSLPNLEREDLRSNVLSKRKEAREHFDSCGSRLAGARFIADMVVGEALGTAFYECTNEMQSVALKVLSGDAESFTNSQAAISQKVNAVYKSAQKELKLKSTG
jgi:hypothetical protein